ncbi:MAG: carboxypeptidase regulatory-like domain-containing protein, partial [Myxococcota bacterium]
MSLWTLAASLLMAVLIIGCTDDAKTGNPSNTESPNTTPDTSGGGCTCDEPTSICPGSITGTVFDANDGMRIGGVQISANRGAQATQTDSSGEYELEVNRCRSPYTVRANLAGYCETTDTLNVSSIIAINNDIQLQERFIGGTVIDVTPKGTTGDPVNEFIEGVKVSLNDTNISDTSGTLGGFLLTQLPQQGELTLIASDESNGCYENSIIERVGTCQGGSGVI